MNQGAAKGKPASGRSSAWPCPEDFVFENQAVPSREAAQECSLGRKPWVEAGNDEAPEGRKGSFHEQAFQPLRCLLTVLWGTQKSHEHAIPEDFFRVPS